MKFPALYILVFFLANLFISNAQSNVNLCSSVFTQGVSSYSNAEGIKFDYGAQVLGTNGIIDIRILESKDSTTCYDRACVYSGNTSSALTLPSFLFSNSSQDINVGKDDTDTINQGQYDKIELDDRARLTISGNGGETRINKLKLEKHSRLTLEEGTYWIEELEMKINSHLDVKSGDKVVIYIYSKKSELGYYSKINNNAGSPENLVMIVYDEIKLKYGVHMEAFLYAVDKVKMYDYVRFKGAVNAKKIELKDNVKITTQISAVDSLSIGNLCGAAPSLPDPLAYYSMNLCSIADQNPIMPDDQGSNDGDASDSASIDYNGNSCQALHLSGSDSFLDIPDPAAVGDLSEGSISLFFNTDDVDFSSDSNKGATTLLSRDASGYRTGGLFSLWVTDSGAVELRQKSGSTSHTVMSASNLIQQNQWYHLVYTWGSDGINLYLDETKIASNSSYTGGFTANGIDMAVGANAWTYDPNSGSSRLSQLSDFFNGSIDELAIFDEQLGVAQIELLDSLFSDPVPTALLIRF